MTGIARKGDGDPSVSSAIAALWASQRGEMLSRVELLEDAVAALLEGTLDADRRREAERAAHKIAGSAGSFGFPESSRHAKTLEDALSGPAPADTPKLTGVVQALRRDLEGKPPTGRPPSPRTGDAPRLRRRPRGDTTLRTLVRQGVTLQVAVVSAVLGLALAVLLVERTASDAEIRHRSVLQLLSDFEFEMSNAESSFRGFALVRRDPFLDRYRSAEPALREHYADLRRNIDEDNRAGLERAIHLTGEWRRNFAEVVLRFIRSGRPTEATNLVNSGAGKRRTDAIRAQLDALRVDERADLAESSDRRKRLNLVLAAVLVLALLFAVAAGVLFGRRLEQALVRPMNRLRETAGRLARGDLAARSEVLGPEEVVVVARAFNDMAGEVESVVEGLRAVDDLKTRFVASVSHELRTPLTSIKGYLQLLENGLAGELEPEQRQYVEVAARNAERLAVLIDDLLMLSRADAGELELEIGEVDVAAELRHLREELAPVAGERGLSIDLDAPGEIVIRGDRRRLHQSFTNLVSNAIKFSPDGAHVEVEAGARDGEVLVEVRDKGVGIPADELSQISDRFFRASTGADIKGTGLGLAITKEIVNGHGGALEIESKVGEGSTFRIRLPRDGAGAAG